MALDAKGFQYFVGVVGEDIAALFGKAIGR
jgi:hypothetical protein